MPESYPACPLSKTYSSRNPGISSGSSRNNSIAAPAQINAAATICRQSNPTRAAVYRSSTVTSGASRNRADSLAGGTSRISQTSSQISGRSNTAPRNTSPAACLAPIGGHPRKVAHTASAAAQANAIIATASATPTPCSNGCINTLAAAITAHAAATIASITHPCSDPGLLIGNNSNAPPNPTSAGTISPRARVASPTSAPQRPATSTVISGAAQKIVAIANSDTSPAATFNAIDGTTSRQTPTPASATNRRTVQPFHLVRRATTTNAAQAISA